MPTERQILGASIRAEAEKFETKHRRPFMGGYAVPPIKDVHEHVAKKFGIDPVDVSYFTTYSRSCEHPWSEGACDACPT